MVGAEVIFLRDIAVVMMVAAATTLLFQRLRLPVVLGYIIAGFIIGPYSPLPYQLVEERGTIEILGQLGIVFLMLGLGLQFNLRKLRKVGLTAILAGPIEIGLMIWVGFVVGRLFGLPVIDSLFLGAIVSISSTVIIVKVVTGLGQQDEKWAQIAFGILIIEDMLAVFILGLLSASASAGGASLEGVTIVLLKLGLFVASALVLGLLIVPRLVSYAASFKVDEVLTVVVIGLALGLSIIGQYLGLSVALGAFIMGAIIAESRAVKLAEERIGPVRDMFTAIFFVAIGMLVDPDMIVRYWPIVAAAAVAVILGKVASVSFSVFITGNGPRTALRTGLGLSQIGEFSFIIAALGVGLGINSTPLFEIAVSVAIITAFTSPSLIKAAPAMVDGLARRMPRSLVTYASLYSAWFQRIKAMRESDPSRARARREVLRGIFFAATAVAIFLLGATTVTLSRDVLLRAVPAVYGIAEVLAWTIVGLLVLPFAYLYFGAVRKVADILSEQAVPARLGKGAQSTQVRSVMRLTFMVSAVGAFGMVLLVAATPFVSTMPVLLLVGALVGSAAVLLYRALSRFETHMEGVLSQAFTAKPRRMRPDVEEGALMLVREKYPWGIEVKEVSIQLESPSIGKTIRELQVRTTTGATIVGILRDSLMMVDPSPDTTLAPLDRLFVVGEPSHISRAEALLQLGVVDRTAPSDRTVVRELRLTGDSLCVGATLEDLQVPERTGARVIGIVREESRIKDPAPETRLEAEDVLLIMGTPESILLTEDIIGKWCPIGPKDE